MSEPRGVDQRIPTVSKRPGNTCPTIDGIIEELESLRKANAALRENAEEWEALAIEYHDAAREWEAHAGELQKDLDWAREQI